MLTWLNPPYLGKFILQMKTVCIVHPALEEKPEKYYGEKKNTKEKKYKIMYGKYTIFDFV